MDRSHIHLKLIEKHDIAVDFFKRKGLSCRFPVYTSVDIRDAGFKITPVDANIYPAGFNNICDVDKEHAPEVFKTYIHKHYGSTCQKILLITEENTSNLFYWDNVFALLEIIRNAGFECKVSFPVENAFLSQMVSAAGRKITLSQISRSTKGELMVDGIIPDLVISNNDFTQIYSLLQNKNYPINPPQELGWQNRKKHNHFSFYNQLANQFCRLIDLDPWIFTIETQLIDHFAWQDQSSIKELTNKVDQMIGYIQKEYNKRQIKWKPFVFIKNNSGTYGMAVTQVTSGQDILNWNNKMRQKMKRGKGQSQITELIIQEGIPSSIRDDEGFVAEPVIYMIGNEFIGGFLRTHRKKSEKENLNSPGAVFKRLCMSDLKINRYGLPLENVYSTVSHLMELAVCQEASFLKAPFHKYT